MEETFSTAAVADLDPEKVNLFSKGLLKILSSKRAEDTFAQIIDGKPTLSGCGMPIMDWKQHWMNVTPKEIESRHQPDPKSIALFQDFRENLRPVDLRISAKVSEQQQQQQHQLAFILLTTMIDCPSFSEFRIHISRIQSASFRDYRRGCPHLSSKDLYRITSKPQLSPLRTKTEPKISYTKSLPPFLRL